MARATAVASPERSLPSGCKPIATFCCTVSHGSNANDWNTIAADDSTPSTGLPRYNTFPAAGFASPESMRKSVLLPQPDGPTSATTSRSRTVSDTSRSASNICPSGRR